MVKQRNYLIFRFRFSEANSDQQRNKISRLAEKEERRRKRKRYSTLRRVTLVFVLTRTATAPENTEHTRTRLPFWLRRGLLFGAKCRGPASLCVERVNGTSQSDVELVRARRANEIHRSTQLTNCSPSVIRHCSLCLSSLSFSHASIPRWCRLVGNRRQGGARVKRIEFSPESDGPAFRSLYFPRSSNTGVPTYRLSIARFQRTLEMIHLTSVAATFIGHWVCISMAR